MKSEEIANVFTVGGFLAFLADIQILITTLVLVTALILNIKNILKKPKDKE